MFANLYKTGQNPLMNLKHRVIFRGVQTGTFAAAAVGQVLALDVALQSADTTSGYNPTAGTSKGNSATATNGPGGVSLQPPDLMWSSAVEPAAESDTVLQVYCVVTDLFDGAGATGTEIEVQSLGRVQVKCASATYVIGSAVMMSATEANRELVAYAAGTTDGQRPLGIVEVGGTTVVTMQVAFNGWAGLGPSQATTN